MKILAKVVVASAILGMLLPMAQEWVWRMKRERVSSQIKASYVQSALSGEVVVPATNSDSLQCWSICFWSLPRTVEVTAPSGNKYYYIACRATNSVRPYNFRFITGRDANGNRVTNARGI
jgi:hypothetical protein